MNGVKAGHGGTIRLAVASVLHAVLRPAESAEADLGEDALAGEQFGGQTDHETHHGQAAIPGFGEVHESEAGLGSVRHGWIATQWWVGGWRAVETS